MCLHPGGFLVGEGVSPQAGVSEMGREVVPADEVIGAYYR